MLESGHGEHADGRPPTAEVSRLRFATKEHLLLRLAMVSFGLVCFEDLCCTISSTPFRISRARSSTLDYVLRCDVPYTPVPIRTTIDMTLSEHLFETVFTTPSTTTTRVIGARNVDERPMS